MSRHLSADHTAIVRTLTDHVDIRRRADEVGSGQVGVEHLHELGARLRDHIRHEERVLFPLAEQALSEAELTQLRDTLR